MRKSKKQLTTLAWAKKKRIPRDVLIRLLAEQSVKAHLGSLLYLRDK